MPVEGIISGVYGSQRILNGKPKWPHYGIDIAAKTRDNDYIFWNWNSNYGRR